MRVRMAAAAPVTTDAPPQPQLGHNQPDKCCDTGPEEGPVEEELPFVEVDDVELRHHCGKTALAVQVSSFGAVKWIAATAKADGVVP